MIHVLSADIPGHNQATASNLLSLYSEGALHGKQRLYVVASSDISGWEAFSEYVRSKRPGFIAWRLLWCAILTREPVFFHGLYSGYFWLMIPLLRLFGIKVYWHIWGADFYEGRAGIRTAVVYAMRRRAMRYFSEVFGTLGDLQAYKVKCPNVKNDWLYFPARHDVEVNVSDRNVAERKSSITVMIGNSGDNTNRHLACVDILKSSRDAHLVTRIICPMGYPKNNDDYINLVSDSIRREFPHAEVLVIRELLSFGEYMELIRTVDCAIFGFLRQQGLGTIFNLISSGVPVYLPRDNPIWADMNYHGLSGGIHVLDAFSIKNDARNENSKFRITDTPLVGEKCRARWQHILNRVS